MLRMTVKMSRRTRRLIDLNQPPRAGEPKGRTSRGVAADRLSLRNGYDDKATALMRDVTRLPLWLIPTGYVVATVAAGGILPRLEHTYWER